MQSLLQRIKHEPRMRRAADAPADNPARKGIDDEGDINKDNPGRDVEHFQTKRNAWRLGKCDQICLVKSETQSRFGAEAWNSRLT